MLPIDTALTRLGREPMFVDEVRQVLRTKLLVGDGAPPKIADYSGRGPLDGWVRAAAVRAAIDLKRREKEVGNRVSFLQSQLLEDLAQRGSRAALIDSELEKAEQEKEEVEAQIKMWAELYGIPEDQLQAQFNIACCTRRADGGLTVVVEFSLEGTW